MTVRDAVLSERGHEGQGTVQGPSGGCERQLARRGTEAANVEDVSTEPTVEDQLSSGPKELFESTTSMS